MRVRILADNDYTFGNGQLDYFINTPAAVGQVVQTSLLLFLGEWYLNSDDGMPWFENVLGKHTKTEADNAIQDYVLKVQGVLDITSYESIIDSKLRKFSVTMTIDTDFGPTPVQVSNFQNF